MGVPVWSICQPHLGGQIYNSLKVYKQQVTGKKKRAQRTGPGNPTAIIVFHLLDADVQVFKRHRFEKIIKYFFNQINK